MRPFVVFYVGAAILLSCEKNPVVDRVKNSLVVPDAGFEQAAFLAGGGSWDKLEPGTVESPWAFDSVVASGGRVSLLFSADTTAPTFGLVGQKVALNRDQTYCFSCDIQTDSLIGSPSDTLCLAGLAVEGATQTYSSDSCSGSSTPWRRVSLIFSVAAQDSVGLFLWVGAAQGRVSGVVRFDNCLLKEE